MSDMIGQWATNIQLLLGIKWPMSEIQDHLRVKQQISVMEVKNMVVNHNCFNIHIGPSITEKQTSYFYWASSVSGLQMPISLASNVQHY